MSRFIPTWHCAGFDDMSIKVRFSLAVRAPGSTVAIEFSFSILRVGDACMAVNVHVQRVEDGAVGNDVGRQNGQIVVTQRADEGDARRNTRPTQTWP